VQSACVGGQSTEKRIYTGARKAYLRGDPSKSVRVSVVFIQQHQGVEYMTARSAQYVACREKQECVYNFRTRSVEHVACRGEKKERVHSFGPKTFRHHHFEEKVKVKVNQSRYRPGVAQRVPGS